MNETLDFDIEHGVINKRPDRFISKPKSNLFFDYWIWWGWLENHSCQVRFRLLFLNLIEKIWIGGVWSFRIHQIHRTLVTGGKNGMDYRSFSTKLKHRCHWRHFSRIIQIQRVQTDLSELRVLSFWHQNQLRTSSSVQSKTSIK